MFLCLVVVVVNAAKKLDFFRETDFGQNMIQDVIENQIGAFYTDLSTSVSNFRDFKELLTFDRLGRGSSSLVFRYDSPILMYHLKQNHEIEIPDDIEITLLIKSENCANLRLENRVINPKTATIDLRRGRLWIPDRCVLYLTRLERICWLPNQLRQQLAFFYRNNQRPQIRGVFSRRILNLNRYNYFTSVNNVLIRPLKIKSYDNGIASFGLDVKVVIPQNYTLLLYNGNDYPTPFESDIVRLIVRPSNCPDASDFQLQQGLSVIEKRDARLEFQLMQHSIDGNAYIHTPVGCELFVLEIFRQIDVTLHPRERKHIQYGVPRQVSATIRLNSNQIAIDYDWYTYVENLRDLPVLQFSSYRFGIAQFQTTMLDFYLVPADTLFHLHTSETRSQCDKIVLVMDRPSNCDLIPTMEVIRGISIQRSKHQFTIQIKRHELNRNYPLGTEFHVQSNCDLQFSQITRTFRTKLSSRTITVTLSTNPLQ